jgi:pimeloyl-ACP methyl ester carboxylesterase
VRLVFLGLVLGGLVAAGVYRDWIRAQARTVVVLATTIETPVLTWAVKALTDEPVVTEVAVAGAPTTLARPGGSPPWPGVVFLNGATRRGRRHPDVQDLARGLARAGYLALVPDLPGLPLGEITDQTVAGAVRVTRVAAARADVEHGRVSLVGVSVGATIALLAAETPRVRDRVALVAGFAPYTDLRKVIRLATTGTYRFDGRLIRYSSDPYLRLAVARSLVAGLPSSSARRDLLGDLERVDDDDQSPLATLRRPRALDGDARAVVRLLLNRDPRRFERLYAALPTGVRAGVRRLSPLVRAERLRVPVELASAPEDEYFPPAESRALAARSRDVRITVTRTLDHAVPAPSLRDLVDLLRFDGFVVRVLHGAAQ